MKSTVLLAVALFAGLIYLRAQTPSTAIVFEKRVHDFGSVYEKNGRVCYTFLFSNKSKAPITIDDIYSDCGCISKVTSDKEVKPGGKGKVLITFNPEYKSGFFSKEIVVYSNNKQHYNRIWVEGKVTPAEHPVEDDYPYNFGQGLYLRLKVMAFGYMKPGETKQMDLHYANDTNREIKVEFSQAGLAKGLVFPNPGKVPAKARGVIKVSFTMPALTNQDLTIKLWPKVNNKGLKETVDIRALNANKLTKN